MFIELKINKALKGVDVREHEKKMYWKLRLKLNI
jgi:hypothetical protein